MKILSSCKVGLKEKEIKIDGTYEYKVCFEERNGMTMTDAELRKLKRTDLLEMLLEQGKTVEDLNAQIEKLNLRIENLKQEKAECEQNFRNQLEVLEEKLADRQLRMENAGSIAKASLELSGIFEAAQNAAQQYLDNIERMNEENTRACEEKKAVTDAEAEKLLTETRTSCETKQRDVENKCAAMEMAVTERCDAMKEETSQQCALQKAITEEYCSNRERETEEKCVAREMEMEEKCQTREREAQERCDALTLKAEQNVEERWAGLSKRLEEFYRAHQGLRELIAATGGIQRD